MTDGTIERAARAPRDEGVLEIRALPARSGGGVVRFAVGALVAMFLAKLARTLMWDGPRHAPLHELVVSGTALLAKPFLLRAFPRPRRPLVWYACGFATIGLLFGGMLLT